MYKKLVLSLSLLLSLQTAPTYVITHQYFYSTPLSMLLVKGYNGDFLDTLKTFDEKDVYFALTEFIRLRPLNRSELASPSVKITLNDLHEKLAHRIKRTENQIKYQYPLDYEALGKSIALLSIGTVLNGITYYLYKKTKDLNYTPCTITFPILGTLCLCGALTYLDDIRNPNRDNKYLEKYKNLLEFVKQLQMQDYSEDGRHIWRQIIGVTALITICFMPALFINYSISKN